jgi:hypothetical protein
VIVTQYAFEPRQHTHRLKRFHSLFFMGIIKRPIQVPGHGIRLPPWICQYQTLGGSGSLHREIDRRAVYADLDRLNYISIIDFLQGGTDMTLI